jgi:alpha-amylase
VKSTNRERSGRSAFLACLVTSSLGTASLACMEFDNGAAEEIELSTHVSDWRNEVVYQLLVDRFADGDAGNNYGVDRSAQGKWHGGDWKGLEDKLDYLSELGVTTIWISPVVKNVDTDAGFDGYHGYWAQDLTAPNPHFGDIASLRRMVRSAHDRDMKIIIDIVTNHMGQLFFYDMNMNGEPDDRVAGSGTKSEVVHINEYDPDFDPRGIQAFTSLGEAGPAPVIFVYDPATNHVPPEPPILQSPFAYNRRGRTLDFDIEDQLLHGDFPGGLKDVNTVLCERRDGLGIKEAMVDSYVRWIELTDADGFRIDTVKHVEYEFWRYFAQKVRQRLAERGKKNFLMFGEAFDGRDELVGSFTKHDPPPPESLEYENACVIDGKAITGDQLDSVFYFPQHFQVIRDVFQSAGPTTAIQSLWDDKAVNYGTTPAELGTGVPPHKLLVTFLDNHDVPRFLWSGVGVTALHNALLFLFTADGLPCIYYGTEQQFAGGNDPSNREDLWRSGYDTQNETFRWIKRLSTLRRSYRALTHGDTTVTWATDRVADESDAGIFAFERTGGDAGESYALVVFNTHKDHPSTPRFEDGLMVVNRPEGAVLVDVLSAGKTAFTVGAGGTLAIDPPLGPQSGMLLVPQDQVIAGL